MREGRADTNTEPASAVAISYCHGASLSAGGFLPRHRAKHARNRQSPQVPPRRTEDGTVSGSIQCLPRHLQRRNTGNLSCKMGLTGTKVLSPAIAGSAL
ncbi:hypothetical protein CORC01_05679 [Colletotrichum orchidophilum]|uniref:Uncharacterized protein n=1 Tax=Colletotrichum orchidophilum TaxID=1209926 RepID=A0A1G4BC51_9PEZI|nr:uncharacterized protein CORC01_05679 [Colletotrichum orchidophilum]OHE98989.1 hypothetical protein CORC01_05679 [Colletotrichum orchidophilum]